MIQANPKQKQIIAILTKGDKDYKAAFVFSQSQDEDKTSTNDLSHDQANNIIVELGGKPLTYDNWAVFDKNNNKHMYIYSLCMQYGWSKEHKTKGDVLDSVKLSEWLKTKAPVNKPLLKMTTTGRNPEISRVISALESMIGKKF